MAEVGDSHDSPLVFFRIGDEVNRVEFKQTDTGYDDYMNSGFPSMRSLCGISDESRIIHSHCVPFPIRWGERIPR